MNIDNGQTTLSQIQKSHREAANLAAESGRIPVEFENDPTFLDLVKTLRREQPKFRGPDLNFVWMDV